MNTKRTDLSLVVEDEELPYYLKAYREQRSNWPRSGFVVAAYPEGKWSVTLHNVTSREAVEFCAFVYAELPEEESPASQRAVEEESFDPSFLAQASAQEDDEEHFEEVEDEESEEEADDEEEGGEDDESLSDLSDTPEGQEVKAKLKAGGRVKLKRAVPAERKLAAAATVVPTENKSVSIEGS